ncbi:hypothetical protein, partial [Rahnella variigena]|uniref:hypothetical protein n=1 Tax=Rahnella variigena TaxID=574964 RepID=UPI00133101C3
GVADAMLASRAASAESQAARAVADLHDAKRRHERDMASARNEIAELRATLSQLRKDNARQVAQSLCAQSIVGGMTTLLLKANGAHPALEAVRQQVAQEAKKIMQKQDALNAGDPHWIGLVETCRTMASNC